MGRRLVFLCLAAAAAAGDDYDQLLAEARKFLADESLTIAERFDAQFDRLGRIALANPRRWEAFYERGENRCKRAFYYRADVDAELARKRAAGMSDAALEAGRNEAEAQIEQWRLEAHREFSLAELIMREQGKADRDRLLFANAAMKFAGREYLTARHGARGAIEDYKELVRRRFLPEMCADHIALCYLDVGHDHYAKREYDEAQRSWDEALRWTRQPQIRQALWTNKAGAYEADHQYVLAEAVLKEQVAADPRNPSPHKNLGLVLGYQNRLKEALLHYDKARELCGGVDGPDAPLHGNAWLRAAVIHGTLLERDGDVLLAWRLFLEYRSIFGDDYNFSLWFGDFAAAHGAYDLAWRYLEHARDLQPRCPPPYVKLTQIAPRTSGNREETEVRVKTAAQALEDARARYDTEQDSPTVFKICGGTADAADLGVGVEPADLLDPDPLAGYGADHPPPWVEEAAKLRDTFVPFKPSAKERAPPEATAPAEPRTPWLLVGTGAVAVLIFGGATVLLVFRRSKG